MSEDIVFVTCPECGEDQVDMGRNVRCENCGFGPMPTEAAQHCVEPNADHAPKTGASRKTRVGSR